MKERRRTKYESIAHWMDGMDEREKNGWLNKMPDG